MRTTRAGLPTTTASGGTSLVTTAPAPTIARLARSVGMAKSTLTKGFKAVFGETILDFSLGCRMRHAMVLMRDRGWSVAKASEAFNKEAKMLDAHLARHKYLVNDTLTIADFTCAAPLFHAQGAAMPVAPYANIGAWFGRVSALPCWSETAPQMAAAA